MKTGRATIYAVAIGSAFWVLESLIHHHLFDETVLELIPEDPNEMWMRAAIVLIIAAFGLMMDRNYYKLQQKEKEKFDIFKATVRSSQHVLNNHLNQMQYFMNHAQDKGLIEEEVKLLYKESIEESSRLLANLSKVTAPEEKHIRAAVETWKQTSVKKDNGHSNGGERLPNNV